ARGPNVLRGPLRRSDRHADRGGSARTRRRRRQRGRGPAPRLVARGVSRPAGRHRPDVGLLRANRSDGHRSRGRYALRVGRSGRSAAAVRADSAAGAAAPDQRRIDPDRGRQPRPRARACRRDVATIPAGAARHAPLSGPGLRSLVSGRAASRKHARELLAARDLRRVPRAPRARFVRGRAAYEGDRRPQGHGRKRLRHREALRDRHRSARDRRERRRVARGLRADAPLARRLCIPHRPQRAVLRRGHGGRARRGHRDGRRRHRACCGREPGPLASLRVAADVWKTYLTIALRQLAARRLYSIVNVAGLTVGLACFILIALFVRYETGHDAQWANADRIFRISRDVFPTASRTEAHPAGIAGPVAALLESDFPEIEAAARIEIGGGAVRSAGGEPVLETKLGSADNALFRIFDFDWISGDPETALT